MNKHRNWKAFSRKALFAAALSVSLLTACQKEDVSLQQQIPAKEGDFVVGSEVKLIPGRYVVVLREESGARVPGDMALRRERVQLAALSLLKIEKGARAASIQEERMYYNAISGFVADISAEQAEELRKDSRVAYVEQDRVITLGRKGWTRTSWDPPIAPTPVKSTQKSPWGIRKVGGAGSGTGKTAWIIDSGIDLLHPDLNVDKTRSKSFLTSAAGGNWASPADESGHGTHVAGTIAAKNNTYGVVGVAAGATVVSLRVFGTSNSGDASHIVKALDYVVANGKAGEVVNLSLGAGAFTPMDDAVRKVAAKGIFVAIAAGNEAVDCANTSPARVNEKNVFTISAMDSLNRFTSFSNYGLPVDYAAPGQQILSTYTGGRYAIMSGTSMAAPHAAGILLMNGGRINYSGTVTGDKDGTADRIAKR